MLPHPGGRLEIPAGKDGRQLIRPHRRLFQGHCDPRTGLPCRAPAHRIDDDQIRPLLFCNRLVHIPNTPHLPEPDARKLIPERPYRPLIVLHIPPLRIVMNSCSLILTHFPRREFRAGRRRGAETFDFLFAGPFPLAGAFLFAGAFFFAGPARFTAAGRGFARLSPPSSRFSPFRIFPSAAIRFSALPALNHPIWFPLNVWLRRMASTEPSVC